MAERQPRPSPRVSVVIPSYNHAAFVEEAVASALAADADLEVVVVDDGSSDDSVARLEAVGDVRLRLFPQANAGAHAALNRGVGLARGELVFVLNSDDAYEPGRIERLAARFDAEPGVALAATWLRVVDAEGEELAVKHGWHDLPPWPRPRPGPSLAALDDPVLALLETNWISTTSNLAFRRSLFTERGLRFAPLRYAHDWDFLLAACAVGRLAVVEEPLVRYRVHGANTIREEAGTADQTARGQGLMRFEILWLLARHAGSLLRRVAARDDTPGHDLADLQRRLWHGLPRFGAESVLLQLLALRGPGDAPPPAYDRLLDPAHPFRRRAVAVLAESPP